MKVEIWQLTDCWDYETGTKQQTHKQALKQRWASANSLGEQSPVRPASSPWVT